MWFGGYPGVWVALMAVAVPLSQAVGHLPAQELLCRVRPREGSRKAPSASSYVETNVLALHDLSCGFRNLGALQKSQPPGYLAPLAGWGLISGHGDCSALVCFPAQTHHRKVPILMIRHREMYEISEEQSGKCNPFLHRPSGQHPHPDLQSEEAK